MSIAPYNNYELLDLSGISQPYVNSTVEFGYFGNLGSVSNCNSMPTYLLTNNGIAIVDASNGLNILNVGRYKLNLSIDCSATSMTTSNNGIIYFNFGTNKLANTTYANVNGSFGGNSPLGMFTYCSTNTVSPGIVTWFVNSFTNGTNSASKYLVSNNQLLWGYYCNNSTNSGPLKSGICTTEITFILNQPTTIFFNIGCIDNNLTTAYSLTMGKSYFTLQLISNGSS